MPLHVHAHHVYLVSSKRELGVVYGVLNRQRYSSQSADYVIICLAEQYAVRHCVFLNTSQMLYYVIHHVTALASGCQRFELFMGVNWVYISIVLFFLSEENAFMLLIAYILSNGDLQTNRCRDTYMLSKALRALIYDFFIDS